MASSKIMASSASRKSDLKRKLSACSSTSVATDLLRSDCTSNAHDNLISLDWFLRNAYGERNPSSDQDRRRSVGEAESCTGTLLNAEINLLDAAGSVSRSTDGEEEPRKLVRKTAEEVWGEIVDGKKSEQQPKEEMMTLEDFLAKAAAKEEEAAADTVDVKEEKLSGGIYSYKNSGVVGIGIGLGWDVGGLGSGRGRRSLSLLEPLDKAAEQRQRRMIKNRESAARSRERKQAYQVELESMEVKLEEENERLLIEKEKLTKKRLKQQEKWLADVKRALWYVKLFSTTLHVTKSHFSSDMLSPLRPSGSRQRVMASSINSHKASPKSVNTINNCNTKNDNKDTGGGGGEEERIQQKPSVHIFVIKQVIGSLRLPTFAKTPSAPP